MSPTFVSHTLDNGTVVPGADSSKHTGPGLQATKTKLLRFPHRSNTSLARPSDSWTADSPKTKQAK